MKGVQDRHSGRSVGLHFADSLIFAPTKGFQGGGCACFENLLHHFVSLYLAQGSDDPADAKCFLKEVISYMVYIACKEMLGLNFSDQIQSNASF